MEPSRKKIIAGTIVFLGVIGVVAVIYNFVQLYSTMPSRSEVMDFATGAVDALPDTADPITGSLVPDSGETSASGGDTILPTSETVAPTENAQDWLTPGQRAMLSTLGIDEADLPPTLTPELEACFVEKLGRERVDVIKSGETPTVIEGIKATTCL
jgi:hypothetical protein